MGEKQASSRSSKYNAQKEVESQSLVKSSAMAENKLGRLLRSRQVDGLSRSGVFVLLWHLEFSESKHCVTTVPKLCPTVPMNDALFGSFMIHPPPSTVIMDFTL